MKPNELATHSVHPEFVWMMRGRRWWASRESRRPLRCLVLGGFGSAGLHAISAFFTRIVHFEGQRCHGVAALTVPDVGGQIGISVQPADWTRSARSCAAKASITSIGTPRPSTVTTTASGRGNAIEIPGPSPSTSASPTPGTVAREDFASRVSNFRFWVPRSVDGNTDANEFIAHRVRGELHGSYESGFDGVSGAFSFVTSSIELVVISRFGGGAVRLTVSTNPVRSESDTVVLKQVS